MSAFVMGLVLTLAGSVHAAVDADLTNAMASSTALITDNKTVVLTFIVGLVGLVLVIKLGKVAIYKGQAMIVRAFKK